MRHGDGFLNRQFVFVSVHLFTDLCDIEILPEMGKKKKWFLNTIPHQAVRTLAKDSWYLKTEGFWKVHRKISRIVLTRVWWSVTFVHHHVLTAVTTWRPRTQAPCSSRRRLLAFFRQTRRPDDRPATHENCHDPELPRSSSRWGLVRPPGRADEVRSSEAPHKQCVSFQSESLNGVAF